jgi:hypothetical protein
MTSPYLDRPTVPLAVALPQMLTKIEAELSNAAGPAEERWLRQRAKLIRWLLAPRRSPGPPRSERCVRCGSRSRASAVGQECHRPDLPENAAQHLARRSLAR